MFEVVYKMVYCAECKVNFSKTSNLRAHVKRKHPGKIDVLAPKIKGQHGTFICKECKATFVRIGSLRIHIQQKHAEKIQELVPAKKTFKCLQCNTEFDMLQKLILHRRLQHAAAQKLPLKCPLCQFTGPSNHLIMHYKTDHSLTVESDILEFKTFEEFQAWKMATEKQSFSSFVNMHGFKNALNCKKIKYTCHRSGNIRKRGKNIRRVKTQRGNKINGYCPAEMSVTIEASKCRVQFCNTHVGHTLEEEEKTNHIMAVGTKKGKSPVLFEEQQKLAQTIQDLIFSTKTLEEIDAIKKLFAPIQPTLEAIRNNQPLGNTFPPPSSISIPSNKNIEPRKLLKRPSTIG